jgi:LPS sulfotransferase NodH
MTDNKIKKILIFACPRSGTTIIQKIIAKELFGIPNLIEPFNDPLLGFDPANPKIVNGQPADLYKWTREQTSGVMKLLAVNLGYVEVDQLLSHGNFDRVVIIERKNLTDCCVSLTLAAQTSRYHYYEGESTTVDPFYCDTKEVDIWILMYRQYLTALAQIKNSGVLYDTICYEDFITDQIQYIANMPLQKSKMLDKLSGGGGFKKMLSLELPYRDLCINYCEVEEKIRKELG